METIIIFLVAIFATTVGAISGVGGGVIMKPVIDAVSRSMLQETISFLSGCTVLAMSLVTLTKSRKVMQGYDKSRAPWLALGAVFGGIIGKELFNQLRDNAANDAGISLIQNIFMVILTVAVLIYMLYKNKIHTYTFNNKGLCVLIGLFLGIFSSFLGIGGGPINLVVLYFFFSLETKEAAWNSIFIILFSQLASFITSLIKGLPVFDTTTLVLMLIGGISGGFIGSVLSKKMSGKQVDKLFMGVILLIIFISLYNVYKFS